MRGIPAPTRSVASSINLNPQTCLQVSVGPGTCPPGARGPGGHMRMWALPLPPPAQAEGLLTQ